MKACPIHGTKFLVTEGKTIYCAAPIPKDKFGTSICFYHIQTKPGPEKALLCSECHRRAPYISGSLCKICRNKKQKLYYKKKIG